MSSRWWAGFVLAMVAELALAAGPADGHRLALAAYHRGDVVGAMATLRPLAKAGHAPSQSLLGFLLERAGYVEDAAKLYAAAAAQDDADGHAGLAHLLLVGSGIAKDETKALAHFSKAAALGHAGAAQVLKLREAASAPRRSP